MSEEAIAGSSQPKTRRRNRRITSCLECRRRKLKCDRVHPCTHCTKGHRDCVFLAPARDPASKSKLNEFKENLETLEKKLEVGHIATTGQDRFSNSFGVRPAAISRPISEVEQPAPDDERNLEPTPFATAEVAYDDDGEDMFDDLGVSLGRMRIAERIGGFVRPAFVMEFSFDWPGAGSDQGADETSSSARRLSDTTDESDTAASYLEPSADYIAPGTGILFSNGSLEDSSFVNFLPPSDLADRLLKQYWLAVHPLARIVHRPTFERQYHHFWQLVHADFEPPASLQALVFGAIFSAAVSVPESTAQTDFGISKKDIVTTLQAGCELALSRSNLLRTTKIDTLQAFVMYLIPLCRAEVSRSHAALTCMAIRLATMSGLHKDGTVFGLSPIEVHVRRLIWHQLCFFDYRTCDAVGPPYQIRTDDFNTRMPLNVDDADLELPDPPQQDADHWTDVTLSRIRFEYVAFSRDLRAMQAEVEKKAMTITAVLRKVEEFRRGMEEKFLHLIDDTVAIQAFALRILRLEGFKLHIRVLNRYAVSAPQAMPPRLRQIVWFSGTSLIELGVELDTTLRFREWAWYSGAIQQYHTALLLLAEVWSITDRRLVDRIWLCFDYIFNIPKFLSRNEKTKLVISKAKTRLDEYQRRRKHRIPVAMQQRMNSVTSPGRSSRGATLSPQTHQTESDGYITHNEAQNISAVYKTDGSLRTSPGTTELDEYSLAGPSSRGGHANRQSARDNNALRNQIQGVPLGVFPTQPVSGFGTSTNTLAGFHDQQLLTEMDVDWDELMELFPLDTSIMDATDPSPENTNLAEFTLPYTSFLPFGLKQPSSYEPVDQ